MKRLYRYIKPLTPIILCGMFLKAVGSLADIFLPLLLSQMIDKGIATGNLQLIVRLCLGMLGIALLSFFSTLTAHYCATRASQESGQRIRDNLYAHLQTLSMEDVDGYSAATLTSRVTFDIERIQSFISTIIRMLVRNGLLAIGGIMMTITIDGYLTVTLLVTMAIIFCISTLVYKFTHLLYRKVQEGLDRSSNIVRESLTGIKTIKAFDRLDFETKRFTIQSAQVRDNEIKAGSISGILSPSITFLSNIGLACILLVSAWRIQGGFMEVGSLIAIISYINMIVHSMVSIPKFFTAYSRASASAGRIAELFETQAHPLTPGENIAMPKQDAAIEFQNVTFCYPRSETPVLKNISFSVKHGSTLAIIGTTGSGKTTIVDLMAGLYQPQKGRILIEGRDIASYKNKTLRRMLSVAQQRYHIFSDTVKKNIILDREFSPTRLKQAIQQAQMESFVDELKSNADTYIFQAGANLSGGQRQRLNVARVFYSDAPILVFDDVASALDYKTNLRLQNELKKVQHKKTIIMIAQRISAIQNSDQILVLHHGIVAGIGTHEQLYQTCKVYKEICESQQEVTPVA